MSDYIFLIHVSLLWPTGRQVVARKMVCGGYNDRTYFNKYYLCMM